MKLEIRWLALLVALLNYLDCVFTLRLVSLCGIESEANPIMRYLISCSIYTFFVYKIIAITLLLFFLAYLTDLWLARNAVLFSALLYVYIMGLHFNWMVRIWI